MSSREKENQWDHLLEKQLAFLLLYTNHRRCIIAREELGFRPQYTVGESIEEYSEWIKRNKKK